jgi:hypothetical protein
MTKEEWAAHLSGREYPLTIARRDIENMQAYRIVVVYGRSDDLMEFSGAIDDEVGAYQGTTVYVDGVGLIPNFDDLIADESIDSDGTDQKDRLRNYFQREGCGREIEAIWDGGCGYSWTYKTTIPHATFDIMDDDETYCRGIVFSLDELGRRKANDHTV